MVSTSRIFINGLTQRNAFVLSFIIFLLSFRSFQPDISIGLDGGYFTAINDFFSHDITLFKNINHTYGPLGFLKNPLVIGDNFLIGFITYGVLLFLFIFFFFELGILRNKNTLGSFLIILFLAYLSNLDFLIYGIITSCILIFHETKNKWVIAIGIFFVSLSYFIKITIAINATLILFSYLIFQLLTSNHKRVYWNCLLWFTITTLLLWLVIYRSYSNLIPYAYTWLSFTIGNADFSSLFPPNNLFLLFSSVFLFYVIPVIDRKSDSKLLFILFGLTFFVTFKYSVARQENLHSKALLDLMIFFSFIFLLYVKEFKPITPALLFLMVIAYYHNLTINGTYHVDDRIKLIRIENIIDPVTDYNHFEKYYSNLSQQNLKERILPDSIVKKIGTSYSDFFPWDYNYIYANKLKYIPRPSLQTAALYTPLFLDKKNAAHVINHPEVKFIIWEKENWGSEMGGIDDKYLLNGDGNYIFELLSNYQITSETSKIRLLQRTRSPRLQRKFISSSTVGWDEWTSVPSIPSGCIRATLETEKGLLRSLKAGAYKTGGKYIEYKLKSGKIIKHRFSEDAEETGIWISPYLTSLSNELTGYKVIAVRFTYTDKMFKMKKEIKINWEHLQLIK